MKNSKISIIVPVYNEEKYIDRCLNSILNQTYDNLQIIVINDGSTDDSKCICESFKKKDNRIELYNTPNGGSVVSRKIGLQKAIGDFVGFVDADDYIDPDMFLELYNLILEYDVDFVHSGYMGETYSEKKAICNYEEQYISLGTFQNKINFINKFILNGTDKSYISFSIWSKLYKAEFIKKCYEDLPNNQQYGEDCLCLLKCIMNAQSVLLSKKTMYHYVIRENTLSHLNCIDYMMKEIGLWQHIINILENYKCFELLKKDIYYFLKKRMVNIIEIGEQRTIKIPHYFYKNIKQIIGKKIIIFGAGQVGQDYYRQISFYHECEIVAWVDSRWNEYSFDYANVVNVDNIIHKKFDIIIIAVKNEKIGEEMRKILINLGISENKIVWKEPGECY